MQSIFEKYKLSGPMKVISFDRKISMVVPGYMSAVGEVLAEAKISVLPVSTLATDHVLVQKADLPRTIRLLRNFVQNCGK
jgi:hypothetical protein